MSPGDGNARADVFWRTKEGFEMHLQLNGASTVEVLDEAHEAVGKIIKAGGEARPSNGAGDGNALDTATVPTKAHPPNCKVCGEKMKFREGESKNGKPYKGFFCQDRDCEGKPVWIDD
jgi:hypothetical protein